MSVEDLMHANLMQVFDERDPGRRWAAIASTYAPDVRFVEAEATIVGHRALDDRVQQLLEEAPGFVFTPVGPVRVVQDMGYLAWHFGPPGSEPVARGADVAFIAGEHITSLCTMLFAA